MIVDIFIKTYYKDYIWLKYCLRSIQKFASGFRNIIIVSDTDNLIPDEYIIPNCKIYYVPIPKITPSYVEHGIGYLWQQNIKLNWFDYTDADAVLNLDSDCMFTTITTPADFMTDGKFNWFYRDWKDAGGGICWKQSTDFLLKIDTKYDSMLCHPFILQRNTSLSLKKYLCSIHNSDTIWNIFVKYNMKTASEFNLFGSYIKYIDSNEYNQIHNPVNQYHNRTIHVSWSWGGLKDEEIQLREQLLSS